jgi:hypothetical protein
MRARTIAMTLVESLAATRPSSCSLQLQSVIDLPFILISTSTSHSIAMHLQIFLQLAMQPHIKTISDELAQLRNLT